MCVLLCIYATKRDSVPLAPTEALHSRCCSCTKRRGSSRPSCVWPLFRFCLLLFSSQVFQSSVLGCWRCLEGGFERNECRRWLLLSSCSLFILPRALGCDYELDTQSCLVTVCLTRRKQNQYFSLIMLMLVGGSWVWLSRELLGGWWDVSLSSLLPVLVMVKPGTKNVCDFTQNKMRAHFCLIPLTVLSWFDTSLGLEKHHLCLS